MYKASHRVLRPSEKVSIQTARYGKHWEISFGLVASTWNKAVDSSIVKTLRKTSEIALFCDRLRSRTSRVQSASRLLFDPPQRHTRQLEPENDCCFGEHCT